MSRKQSSARFIFPPPPGPSWWFVLLVAAVVSLMGVGAAYAFTPLHDLVAISLPNGHEGAFLASRKPPTAVRAAAATKPAVTATPLPVQTPAPVPTAAPQDTRFAVLLMGYGGSGHDGAYLTDSMMVVVVDAERKTLTMLSVPRDSWVPLAMTGKTTEYNKINTAYAFAKDPTLYPDRLQRYAGDQGAGNFAADTVSRITGIPISFYLALDFQGFRDMIDAVGGVDVEIPDSFSARYPANDDPAIDASWKTVRFTKGPEHMNGERAIEYARARETLDNPDEGSDFARSRRQRLIMEAFKTRLLEPGGMIHLPQLLGIAAKHVDTNYSIPDVAKLSQLVLGWKNVTIYQTALTALNYLDEGTGPDGTYVLVPNAPGHSWAQIRAYGKRLWNDPATAVAMADATIVVENGTTVPGEAGRLSEDLMKLGYRVGDPITAPRRTTTVLIDKSGGKLAPVIQQLTQDLGLPDLQVENDGSDPMPVLILEIGSDEANLSLNVPEDTAAPASALGLERPTAVVVAPPPTATPVPRRSPSPVRSPTPVEAAKPVPTATPVKATSPGRPVVAPSPTPLPPRSRQVRASKR